MKKIITLALLSTVALNPQLKAAAALDAVASEGEVAAGGMGIIARSDKISSEALEVAKGVVEFVNKGKLPEELLRILEDVPKVELPLIDSKLPLMELRAYLNEHWHERIGFIVNAFLKTVTTPVEDLPIIPFAHSFFDDMAVDLTADEFFVKISQIYKLFVLGAGPVSFMVNTPCDLATFQFFSLFWGNWLSRMNVSLNISGLGDPGLVSDAVHELQSAGALNILGLHGYDQDGQVAVLRSIAEIRPARIQILIEPQAVSDLATCFMALADPGLSAFSEGRKIDVNMVVNFTHPAFYEDTTTLREMFESLVGHPVPYVWDLMLRLTNIENIAYGDLTPVMRSIVRSSVAGNLCIGTLTPDNPAEVRIMTSLREEFLSVESQVRMLDLEGSILSDEGWEQLALLAEAGKPFYKVRLTGMSVPGSVARRLGALRVDGINMAGCGIAAEDLLAMCSGLLGEGSHLVGVDLRGNGVDDAIVELFMSAGFVPYLQNRVLPFGVMFAKPMN